MTGKPEMLHGLNLATNELESAQTSTTAATDALEAAQAAATAAHEALESAMREFRGGFGTDAGSDEELAEAIAVATKVVEDTQGPIKGALDEITQAAAAVASALTAAQECASRHA